MDEAIAYQVVVNDEEQYSIWLAESAVPNGWRPIGRSGPKADCLQYINQVWTDLRPASLRRSMEQDVRLRERPSSHS
jgi:MbtH protein